MAERAIDSPIDTDAFRVTPGETLTLSDRPTKTDPPLDKDAGKALFKAMTRRLRDLQETLYAESEQSVLVIFQAMDAGGKDSTTRHVFGSLNPQGVRVSSFKAPSESELAHDFLWRVHAACPRRGMIRVFNRSHYEDVLVAKVKRLAPAEAIERRYDHINAFERLLTDNRTQVVKFMLHISKDYQKKRLQRRLDRPDKHWKFDPADLAERARWEEYQEAFESALGRCSTEACPWYVVPAERRWFRNLIVAQVLTERLAGMDMRYPEPTFDLSDITID